MKIGLIPFGSDTNPYQELTRRALVAEGLDVRTFPKSNWLPLWRAARSGVDVLHLDWPHSFYRGAGPIQCAIKRSQFRWQLSRLGQTKVVWTVHNLQSHDAQGQPESELEWLVQRADALVSLSQKGVALIQRKWPATINKPITVIPLGHFGDWYDTAFPAHRARQLLQLPDRAKVAVFAGRLQPYKGIEDLIPAFINVASENDWLLVAGGASNPEYAERLRRLIKNHPRIKFYPRLLDRIEMGHIMVAADFAVFPFQEIFNSASVILALSFGKPVVAPALGALEEVIPKQAWFSVERARAEELDCALRTAFACDNLAERGALAVEKMRVDHSWKIVGARLSNLYRSLTCQ